MGVGINGDIEYAWDSMEVDVGFSIENVFPSASSS
jgi:hypothetical protein